MCELFELLAFGRQRLHFAETRMNRHSSRSHAVCVVTVQRTVGPATAPAPTGGDTPAAEAPAAAAPLAHDAEAHAASGTPGTLAGRAAAADAAEERAAAARAR